MEFIKANLINTTTQIAVSSNTSTVANIFNRDPYYQYYTDGLNNDLTTGSVTITFDATTAVSRLAIKDINLKEFSIYYNGVTANTFALTTTASTIASSFISNSETSIYFRFSTVQCSSITIDMKKTITADQEKILGLFVISDLYLELTQIPDAKGYKPILNPRQIVHTLSDGGTRIHNVRKKFNISLSLDYVPESLRDSLKTIYDLGVAFNFCPFGTTTSWDTVLVESVWTGPFNFYEFSDNAVSAGFSGSIQMKETPV